VAAAAGRLGFSQAEIRERLERNTVPVDKPATVFWISPLVGKRAGVKATKCQLLFLYDGPYAQHDRAVQLSTRENGHGGRAAYYTLGGGWPAWVVAVEGHKVPDDFPEEPEAFNRWLDAWLKLSGAKVICDYRKEAETDGALDWMKPRNAGSGEPEPVWSEL
jgi:hypothetical protein